MGVKHVGVMDLLRELDTVLGQDLHSFQWKLINGAWNKKNARLPLSEKLVLYLLLNQQTENSWL